MSDYCSNCDRPINGFAYGFGFNQICGRCHDEESRQTQIVNLERERLSIERERLKLERDRLELERMKGGSR